MNPKVNWLDKRQALRAQAERMLSSLSPEPGEKHATDVLMHELLVHRVELEMQVEELQGASLALEASRDSYRSLYENAAMAYVSLDRDGLIAEMNLAAAALLGRYRHELLKCPFIRFITPEHADRWQQGFATALGQNPAFTSSCMLRLVRADGQTVHCHVDCSPYDPSGASPMVQLALFDMARLLQANPT